MKQIEPIGNFEKRNFPQFRNPTIDTMIWGRQRHHVPILSVTSLSMFGGGGMSWGIPIGIHKG